MGHKVGGHKVGGHKVGGHTSVNKLIFNPARTLTIKSEIKILYKVKQTRISCLASKIT